MVGALISQKNVGSLALMFDTFTYIFFALFLIYRRLRRYQKMSIQLMHECKKKLSNCLSKTQKLFDLFSTTNLEKQLYDTCKADSNCKQTRDSINKLNNQYQSNLLKLRQLIDQGI